MNIKKTLFIALILIVVLVVYMWDQRRIQTNKTQEETSSRLVRPKGEAISEITIKTKDHAIKLEKHGDVWDIVQPVEARMDEGAARNMIFELDRAKKNNAFEAKGNLEDYGLKSPQTTVEFKSETDHFVQDVKLGALTSAGDRPMLRSPITIKSLPFPSRLQTT